MEWVSPAEIEIDGYRRLRLIGQGGFGQVFMAAAHADHLVALKIIRRNPSDDDRAFKREVAAIRRYMKVCGLHNALIQVLHVKQDEHALCYVMPLADPQIDPSPEAIENYAPDTLEARLVRCQRISIRQSIPIVAHLLDGLYELHRAGLVHRDIKPGNVVFIRGLPVLSDVGLVTDSQLSVSMSGTRGYFPADGAGKVSGDIYAMGMLLYRMTSGKSPEGNWPNYSRRMRPDDEQLFDPLMRVLTKACNKFAQYRYGSARTMAAALRQVLKPPAKAVVKAKARRTSKIPVIRSKLDLKQAVVHVLNEAVAKARLHFDMNNQWLTPAEMVKVANAVKSLFRKLMGHVPPDITSSCLLAEAIVEGDASRKKDLLTAAFTVHDADEAEEGTSWIPSIRKAGEKVSVYYYSKKYTFRDPDQATKVALESFTDNITVAIEDNWDEYQAALLD